MSNYPQCNEYAEYKDWKEEVLKRNSPLWQHINGWFFPTPENHFYRDHTEKKKYYHLCEENWQKDIAAKQTNKHVKACDVVCEGCGEEIPDGIKMIMSLLTW